jgi:hypothetical protein
MPYGTLNVDKIVNDDGVTFAGLYGFKNRIINGGMVIDQRNNGASLNLSATGQYTVDRWVAWEDTDGTMTAQQSSVAPAGFTNSLLFTTGTADASLGATQFAAVQQRIEGFNVADLGWGTASAQTVTVSFWVRSSLTGTFGGVVKNAGGGTARSYPFTYTISSANTWEQKTVTIAGDTSGTWLTNNGIGLNINFGLGVGSTYNGTAGSWQSADLLSATGATSVIGTAGATFYITGVQLERGSVATSFDFRSYGTEFALCQRYYYVMSGFYIEGYANAATIRAVTIPVNFPVTMRATPTRTVITTGSYTNVRGNSSAYAGLGLLGLSATFASASIESAAAGLVQCSNQTESMSAEL